MYLAPLNYDRFFRKVFSDVNIAKRFLEDFFDATIEHIEPLPSRHKITDDSTAVEFDYRVKMDGRHVIIDMQQWYKTDLVKRFYVYHCLNSALQLEGMSLKSFAPPEGDKKKESKDYSALEPAITLIWLVEDGMGVEDDWISYALTPEILPEFLRDQGMWRNERFQELMEKRAQVLKLLDNKTSRLDFLSQNRLIYALQKNIVKNTKYSRYLAWFEFAERTRNRENRREDFEKFAKDAVFSEVIRRLNKETLQSEDFQYIEDYEKFATEFKLHEASIRKVAVEDGIEIGKEIGKEEGIEIGKEIGKEEGIGIGKEIGKEEGIEIGKEIGKEEGIEIGKALVRHEERIKTAEKCLSRGMSIEDAAEISELPLDEVELIARRPVL